MPQRVFQHAGGGVGVVVGAQQGGILQVNHRDGGGRCAGETLHGPGVVFVGLARFAELFVVLGFQQEDVRFHAEPLGSVHLFYRFDGDAGVGQVAGGQVVEGRVEGGVEQRDGLFNLLGDAYGLFGIFEPGGVFAHEIAARDVGQNHGVQAAVVHALRFVQRLKVVGDGRIDVVVGEHRIVAEGVEHAHQRFVVLEPFGQCARRFQVCVGFRARCSLDACQPQDEVSVEQAETAVVGAFGQAEQLPGIAAGPVKAVAVEAVEGGSAQSLFVFGQGVGLGRAGLCRGKQGGRRQQQAEQKYRNEAHGLYMLTKER